jgi:hypothetical protein
MHVFQVVQSTDINERSSWVYAARQFNKHISAACNESRLPALLVQQCQRLLKAGWL